MIPLQWITVPGGVCRYGDLAKPVPVPDLEWSATPITVGQLDLPGWHPDTPVTCVDQPTAARVAADLGGRLPRSTEWEWMAAGPGRRTYPWGEQEWRPSRAQLAGSGQRRAGLVWRHPGGATPDGIQDVAGLVWEWTSRELMGESCIVRGGSYCSAPLYARTTFLNAAPAELASAGIGFRVVRQP